MFPSRPASRPIPSHPAALDLSLYSHVLTPTINLDLEEKNAKIHINKTPTHALVDDAFCPQKPKQTKTPMP